MTAPQEQSSRPPVEAIAENNGDRVWYLRQAVSSKCYDHRPLLDGLSIGVTRWLNLKNDPSPGCRVELSVSQGPFHMGHDFSPANARLLGLALLQAADDADGHAASLLTQAVLEGASA